MCVIFLSYRWFGRRRKNQERKSVGDFARGRRRWLRRSGPTRPTWRRRRRRNSQSAAGFPKSVSERILGARKINSRYIFMLLLCWTQTFLPENGEVRTYLRKTAINNLNSIKPTRSKQYRQTKNVKSTGVSWIVEKRQGSIKRGGN